MKFPTQIKTWRLTDKKQHHKGKNQNLKKISKGTLTKEQSYQGLIKFYLPRIFSSTILSWYGPIVSVFSYSIFQIDVFICLVFSLWISVYYFRVHGLCVGIGLGMASNNFSLDYRSQDQRKPHPHKMGKSANHPHILGFELEVINTWVVSLGEEYISWLNGEVKSLWPWVDTWGNR